MFFQCFDVEKRQSACKAPYEYMEGKIPKTFFLVFLSMLGTKYQAVSKAPYMGKENFIIKILPLGIFQLFSYQKAETHQNALYGEKYQHYQRKRVLKIFLSY